MILNLQPLDWLVISFVLFSAIFIIFKTRVNSNREVDHILMGRQLTLPLFVATLVASWYGGILGVTQISSEKGVYNFVTQGFFWYLSAIFFAIFIAGKANKSQAMTLPELIGDRCGEKSRIITAVFFFFKTLPIPYAISIGILLNIFIGIDTNIGIVIACILISIYCYFGGLKAVVVFDVFQFSCMFIAIISVVLVSYFTYGGTDYLLANLPHEHLQIIPEKQISNIFLWFIIAANTTLLSPIFYQRCFAAKSKSIARRGILTSVLFWFICDIFTTLCGLYAKAKMPQSSATTAFITYALDTLPLGLKGLFVICMLLTVISAMDAFFLVASNIVSHDIIPTKTKNRRLHATLICAVFTAILAPYFEGKLELVWLSFETYFIAILLVPILMVIFRKSTNERAFIFTITANSLLALMLTIFEFSFIEIFAYCSLFGLMFSFLKT